MKIYYLLIFLLIIPIASADIEYKLYKENYSPSETLQGEISIINATLNRELTTNNIKLIDNNGNNIFLSKNFLKVNNTYMFYFDLPQISGEYNLILNDFYYTKDGVITKGEIKKTVVIINSSNSVSIKPGFYYNKLKSYEEAKFSLTIKNNGNSSESFEIIDNEYIKANIKKFNIASKQSKILEISTTLFNKKESNIKTQLEVKYTTGNYQIPVIIERTGITTITNNTNITINETKPLIVSYNNALILNDEFGAELPLIKLKSNANVTSYANLTLKNKLNVKLTDITVKLTNNLEDIIQVYPVRIDEINANGERTLLITANKNKNLAKNYTGEIEFKSEEGAILNIPFTIILNTPKITITQSNTTLNNTRNNAPINEIKKDNTSNFWIYVIIFFIALMILIFYVYRKGKPKEKEFNEFIERVKRRQ